jgi:hypothetical protein
VASSNPIDLAWAACFVETDGTIYIRKPTSHLSSSPVVCIYNTERRYVKRWLKIVGMEVKLKPVMQKGSRLPIYRPKFYSRNAERILKLIFPYMTPGTKKYFRAEEGLRIMESRPIRKGGET